MPEIKDFIGKVEYNIDPEKKGRIKVRVFGKFENIPVEGLPWATPDNRFFTGQYLVPRVGEIVCVRFDNDDTNMPLYGSNVNADKSFRNEVLETNDEPEKAFSLAYSEFHKVRIYSAKNDGLVIGAGELVKDNPLIRLDREKKSIYISADNIYIANSGADSSEPAVRGETLKNILDRLCHAIINHNHLSSAPGTPTSPPTNVMSHLHTVQANLNKMKHTVKDVAENNKISSPPSWEVTPIKFPPQPQNQVGGSANMRASRSGRNYRFNFRNRRSGVYSTSCGQSSTGYIQTASNEIGVTEENWSQVDKYFQATDYGKAAVGTHWCGAFVAWVMKQNGIQPPSGAAGSANWANWGVQAQSFSHGAILYCKNKSGGGHVGIWDAERGGLIGGNQGAKSARGNSKTDGVTLSKGVPSHLTPVAWRFPPGGAVVGTCAGNTGSGATISANGKYPHPPQAYISAVIKEGKNKGYSDDTLRALLACIDAETGGYQYVRENGFYDSAKRIESIFSNRKDKIKEPYENLVRSEKLLNYVYSNEYGNGHAGTGDGYRYRGCGLIQTTFKTNFILFDKQLGINSVANPDVIYSTPELQAKCIFVFLEHRKCNKNGDLRHVLKKITGNVRGDYFKKRQELLVSKYATMPIR